MHRPGLRGQRLPVRSPGHMGLLGWSAVIMIVLTVGRFAEFLPGIRGLPLVKVAALLVIVALIMKAPATTSSLGWHSPLSRTALALCALATGSILFSIWKSQSLLFLKNELPVLTLIYLVVARASTSWFILKRLLAAFEICALVLAAFAISGYGGGRASVESWYDTNDLAYVLVTLLPVGYALSRIAAGWRRWFWLGQCALSIMVIVLTGSRGGSIALALTLCWYLFVGDSRAQPAKRGMAILKSLTWFMVIVAVGVISWPHLPEETRTRLQSITNLGNDYNMEAGNRDSRTDIWKRALNQLAGRPIGFGIGTFPAVDGRTGGIYHTAHNSVVLVSVELGIIGLFLYLRMYMLAWRHLGRRMAPDAAPTDSTSDSSAAAEQRIVAGNLRIALLANFVAGFFLSQCYSFLIWGVFALIAGFEPQLPVRKAAAAARGQAGAARYSAAKGLKPRDGR